MKPTYSHAVSLLFSLLLLHSISAVDSAAAPPDTATTTTTVDAYIQKCCQITLYPSLCYSSLSEQYPGPADLGSLTCAAMRLSLTEATSAAKYMAAKNSTAGMDKASPAVKDCRGLTRSAVGQVRRSLKLMVKVVSAYTARGGAYNETEKGEMRFDMSSVQTWMSAGMTDQSTCMGGFKDVGVKDDDEVEGQVYRRVVIVNKLISNALALLNSYVDNAFH